jgi:hypothetical protein
MQDSSLCSEWQICGFFALRHSLGLAEMTITAQALQISVPLVVAIHLFRVVVVNMGTQYIYTFTTRLRGRSPRRKAEQARENP